MNFHIADTFTDRLGWLTGEEQKAVMQVFKVGTCKPLARRNRIRG